VRESRDGGTTWRTTDRLLEGCAPYLWRIRRLRDGSFLLLASMYGTPWGKGLPRATRNTMLPGETYLNKIQTFLLHSRDGVRYSGPHYVLPGTGAHEYDMVELSDGTAKKVEEVEKQYEGQAGFDADMEKVAAIAGINVEFSKEAVRTVDSIFGEDTVKKVFRDTYNHIPDFLPSVHLLTDFFEQVTSYMEKLFNRKLEAQEKASKARMAKYQPQDHRPPQRRKSETVADQSRGKDAEIGRAVSEIVSRGNDAEVKRGRDGDILVLEVRKKIIKRIKGL